MFVHFVNPVRPRNRIVPGTDDIADPLRKVVARSAERPLQSLTRKRDWFLLLEPMQPRIKSGMIKKQAIRPAITPSIPFVPGPGAIHAASTVAARWNAR